METAMSNSAANLWVILSDPLPFGPYTTQTAGVNTGLLSGDSMGQEPGNQPHSHLRGREFSSKIAKMSNNLTFLVLSIFGIYIYISLYTYIYMYISMYLYATPRSRSCKICANGL